MITQRHPTSPLAGPTAIRPTPVFLSLMLALAAGLPAGLSAQGKGSLLTTNGLGSLTNLNTEGGWRTTWHIAAVGNFDGIGYRDVLIYDRLNGDGRFLSVDSAGDFSTIALNTNWSDTWDQIVPGNFGGSSQTDLLFYSATTGVAKFYTTGANGALTLLQTHSGWNEWDTIVTGQFGGSTRSDLFLYSRTRGEGKFFTTDGAGNITLLANYTALNKNWDQIVAGDFNGDGLTDLFFYQRVLGEAKFYSTDGNGGLQLMSSFTGLRTSWDLVVPGQFGGSLRTDLLFYDRTAGEARIALVDGSGGWVLQPVVSAPKTWSLVASGQFEAGGLDRVFAYDNTVRVRIHAVKCSDDDGGRTTAITPAQVQSWIDRANIVYARAGVQIEFDPSTDFEAVQSTALNTLDLCSEFSSSTQCDYHKAAATYFASQHPCKVVVLFRWGNNTGASGSGFSSETANYVAMPGFNNTVTTLYFQNSSNPLHGTSVQGIKLLAHELGHFFGLDHTFLNLSYAGSATPHDRVVSYLSGVSNPTMQSLDDDHDKTWDTPPDVKLSYFTYYGWNPADLTQEIQINAPSLGLNFTFSPDRHNVMSYFGICDDYLRLSPDQVRKVREVLHTAKLDYINACAHHVDGTQTHYGTGCSGTSGITPLHGLSGNLEVGSTINFRVSNAATNSLGLLLAGDQRVQVSLAVAGMPGCDLLVNGTPSVSFVTTGSGLGAVSVAVPASAGLIGAKVTSQVAVLDPSATTALPLVMSNGVELRIGGDR